MTDYKVNFQDLKAKVGIDDVALRSATVWTERPV